jgi:cysteine desulfurase
MNSRIYLDYCATTPIHPTVRAAMQHVIAADFGNPSSLHWAGQNAVQLVKQARIDLSEGIGCQPGEIYFTSGATEADNLALFGTLRRYPPNEAHLITSTIEHHAILHAAQQLEHEGYAVTYVPVDQKGLINLEDVRHAIRKETKLISIMCVNNEMGAIQPVAEIGTLAHEHGIAFHTDAVQAIGLLDINLSQIAVDLLSLSGHKIYGPKGIGALFVKAGHELKPMFFGGTQERSLRPGTENVPGLVGLGAAMKLIYQHRARERERLSHLREQLINGLKEIDPNVIVNGPEVEVAPHVLSVSFMDAEAEMLLIRLNQQGIAVSLGSACNSKSIEPSHVLTAMGLPREQIESTLRISLGLFTTTEEVDAFLKTLAHVLPLVSI